MLFFNMRIYSEIYSHNLQINFVFRYNSLILNQSKIKIIDMIPIKGIHILLTN